MKVVTVYVCVSVCLSVCVCSYCLAWRWWLLIQRPKATAPTHISARFVAVFLLPYFSRNCEIALQTGPGFLDRPVLLLLSCFIMLIKFYCHCRWEPLRVSCGTSSHVCIQCKLSVSTKVIFSGFTVDFRSDSQLLSAHTSLSSQQPVSCKNVAQAINTEHSMVTACHHIFIASSTLLF